MATIWERGPYQFCARVRRNGATETRTFESRKDAERWAAIIEGKIVGDDYDDRRQARDTSLAQACDWMSGHLDRSRSDAKNKVSKLRYWQSTHLASWSLLAIRPADLIDWRRAVLDEDGAEDGAACGPDAECGQQTVIHRLNVLSQVYKRWSLDHDVIITNPVVEGVRPSLPGGRDRRAQGLQVPPDRRGPAREARAALTRETARDRARPRETRGLSAPLDRGTGRRWT